MTGMRNSVLWRVSADLRRAINSGNHKSGVLDVQEIASIAEFCADRACAHPETEPEMDATREHALGILAWAAQAGTPKRIRRAAQRELAALGL